MSKFTVRVELTNATAEDYEKLRGELEERGFSRLLSGGDGGKYILRATEYSLDAGWTVDHVLSEVKSMAASTHRKCSILVTEALCRRWYGLEEAKY
jgi:hypothetical protein